MTTRHVKARIDCKRCKGKGGWFENKKLVICSECNGRGEKDGTIEVPESCSQCKGKGWIKA